MNILLITLDQFRGDCLSCAGHPIVRTPHLDRLAREGVRLARHYSQAAPCSPGRASLYTGLYQMNHRVVGNGAPLDARFDNVAKAARRAGYTPVLFGYTDQSIDPREATGPDDPRLHFYEGVLPGFDIGCELAAGDPRAWLEWLRALGYALPADPDHVLASEPDRPAEHSMSAFLTDQFLAWVTQQKRPWFAHVSQFRPHPPYAAAGQFAKLYDPDLMPAPIAPSPNRDRMHEGLMRHPLLRPPETEAEMRRVTANYFGMVSEADYQLGRIWETLEAIGAWNDTFIIVTSDHGEQLGDHGLVQKAGYFEQSYHILGLVRDPRLTHMHGGAIERFTETIDIFPTLCDVMNIDVPAQCDGMPLTPLLQGETPPLWREAAHWEFDWRGGFIAQGPHLWPWDRRLERLNLAVMRDDEGAYVHFADGRWLAFDLKADPSWRTPMTAPERVLVLAQKMLSWRAQHLDRTLTGMLIEKGGIGRWPPMPLHWEKKSEQS